MNTFRHLFDSGKVIYETSCYGGSDLEIRDATEDGESVRLLLVGGARESASYNDKAHRNDLVFRYALGFNEIFTANPDLNSALLIGGAGFSYPKYFISHFPKKTLDVVEIDPVMLEIAFKYFYLDELYDEFDLYKNERLKIFIMDGNDYLKQSTKKYDIIFNDAYVAENLDETLLTDESVKRIKDRLNPEGIYVINMITSLSGPHSKRGVEEFSLLKKYFAYTEFRRCRTDVPATERQNCLLIGSNRPF